MNIDLDLGNPNNMIPANEALELYAEKLMREKTRLVMEGAKLKRENTEIKQAIQDFCVTLSKDPALKGNAEVQNLLQLDMRDIMGCIDTIRGIMKLLLHDYEACVRERNLFEKRLESRSSP